MDQKLNYDVLTKSLAINHKQIAISLESPLMINKVYNDFRENGFVIERESHEDANITDDNSLL